MRTNLRLDIPLLCTYCAFRAIYGSAITLGTQAHDLQFLTPTMLTWEALVGYFCQQASTLSDDASLRAAERSNQTFCH
jgi:hypothetical protein